MSYPDWQQTTEVHTSQSLMFIAILPVGYLSSCFSYLHVFVHTSCVFDVDVDYLILIPVFFTWYFHVFSINL